MNESRRNCSSIGHYWKDVEKELFTPDEIAASELRVAIIGYMIRGKLLAPLEKTPAVVPLKNR